MHRPLTSPPRDRLGDGAAEEAGRGTSAWNSDGQSVLLMEKWR